MHEEVQGADQLLLRCVRSTDTGPPCLLPLHGERAQDPRDLDAPGYRESRPVRAGNGATTQTQLGTFGDLFDTVWRYVNAGHLLDPPPGDSWPSWPTGAATSGTPRTPGIWELTETGTTRSRRWAAGSLWTALSSCTPTATSRPPTSSAGQRERDAIRRGSTSTAGRGRKSRTRSTPAPRTWTRRRCSPAQTGFDRGERLAGTVAAIHRELARRPAGLPLQRNATRKRVPSSLARFGW